MGATWDVLLDAPGSPGSDGGWQAALWSRFRLPSRPRGWQGSRGLHSPVPKAAPFSTVQETSLVSLGVPAAQGARRPWSLSLCVALSNPFLCRRPPCFLKAVEGDFLGSGGLFSAVYSELQDKPRPWLPCLPGRGRLGPCACDVLWSGAVDVLVFNPLLPGAEDVFQTVCRFSSCSRCADIHLPSRDAAGRSTARCGPKQQHFEAKGGVTVWVKEGEDVPFPKPQGCSRVPSQANSTASGCRDGDDGQRPGHPVGGDHGSAGSHTLKPL